MVVYVTFDELCVYLVHRRGTEKRCTDVLESLMYALVWDWTSADKCSYNFDYRADLVSLSDTMS